MKRLLFIALLFVAFDSFSQPLNYTRIANRYRWISGMFDSALYVPRYNGTPSGVRVGENSAIDGAVAVDTANHRMYIYSGGAWVRLANYAEIPAAYTAGDGLLLTGSEFKALTKRSITIDSDSIMLVNDTTATPANYFYGTNVAGRKGWYAQSALDPYTFTNGLTESGGTVKWGGPLINEVEIDAGNNYISISNLNSLTLSTASQSGLYLNGDNVSLTAFGTGTYSDFKVQDDTIIARPHRGAYYIDSLNYTLSTTGKKIMLRDTATGLVQNIDPSLLTVSGITAGSQGQIYQTSNGAAAWKYDTTTLVTFTAGANFAADTAAFTDSTIYGSFKLMGNDTFYVTGVSVVLYSNNAITDTLGIQITYNDTINVIGSHVFAATYAVNNGTTGQDATSANFTGSASVPIPPGNWVWLKSPTVVAGRKPYHMSVSIIGYKKRLN